MTCKLRTITKFTVRCTVNLEKEESLYILGNVPELGSWRESNAVSMDCVSGDENGCTWSTEVHLQTQVPVEYKYIVKQKQYVTRWETLPGNRTIVPGVTNCAYKKPCEQSSTFAAQTPPVPGPRSPRLGNNGNTNGYHEWLLCGTNWEYQPWWQVDLEDTFLISSIILWNRQDRDTQRLFPCWIMISNEEFGSCSFEEAKLKSLASRRFTDSFRISQWFHNEGLNVRGRYVRIQLERTGSLRFAELDVYRSFDPSVRNAEYLSLCEGKDTNFTQLNICHEVDDGIFGMENSTRAEHTELKLQIDDGWLTPEYGSELRILLGSSAETESIHLFNPCHVAVQLRVERNRHIHLPRTSSEAVLVATTDAEKIGDNEDFEPYQESTLIEHHVPITTDNKTASTSKLNIRNRYGSISDMLEKTMDSRESIETNVLCIENLRKIEAIKNLSDEEICSLVGKMERSEYEKDSVIIKSGDARKFLFVVASGSVASYGQNTIVGERCFEVIGVGNWFGENALLGGGIRTATIRASETTVCYRLHRDNFIEVIGKTGHKSLRERLIRSTQYVPTSTSLMKWQSDDSKAFEATEIANFSDIQPIGNLEKLEVNDIQMFRVSMHALEHQTSRFMLDVYSTTESKLVGTAYFLPSQFQKSNGCLTAPILDTSARFRNGNPIVGQCLVRYLIINPLIHPQNGLSVVWRNYWRTRPTLDVGHRGLGRSYHQDEGYRKANVRENTLVSFVLAGQLGADYIEFDVQLTKDRIPIVYHDFFVEVELHDYNEGGSGEYHTMGIHELTLRHIKRCHIFPVKKQNNLLQRLIKKHWLKILSMSKNNMKNRREKTRGGRKTTIIEHLLNAFPQLQDVLERVPEHVGLNLEVKYPIEMKYSAMRDLPAFEMNDYLDTILKCVFDYAKNRKIIFSCFDPDICVMLRAKQARYPVFFLTCGGTDLGYNDTRCLSLPAALMFSKMERLQGIVTESRPILENPSLVSAIKKHGLLLFSYGSKNTDHEAVQLQKMHGVDAVISDNVGDLTKLDGKTLRRHLSVASQGSAQLLH